MGYEVVVCSGIWDIRAVYFRRDPGKSTGDTAKPSTKPLLCTLKTPIFVLFIGFGFATHVFMDFTQYLLTLKHHPSHSTFICRRVKFTRLQLDVMFDAGWNSTQHHCLGVESPPVCDVDSVVYVITKAYDCASSHQLNDAYLSLFSQLETKFKLMNVEIFTKLHYKYRISLHALNTFRIYFICCMGRSKNCISSWS